MRRGGFRRRALPDFLERHALQPRRVATLIVENQLLRRPIDVQGAGAERRHQGVDVVDAGARQADVGPAVVADHHHQVRHVVERQLHAGDVVQVRQVAAAEMLVADADLDGLVPLHLTLPRFVIERDEHRQLEGRRHRKLLVGVDGDLGAAFEMFDRDTHAAARFGHRLRDVRPQTINGIRRTDGELNDRYQEDDGAKMECPLHFETSCCNRARIVALSSCRRTEICSPLRRSLSPTSPRARSSSPRIATNGTLRADAYLNCLPSLSASGYTSTRSPLFRSSAASASDSARVS